MSVEATVTIVCDKCTNAISKDDANLKALVETRKVFHENCWDELIAKCAEAFLIFELDQSVKTITFAQLVNFFQEHPEDVNVHWPPVA